MEAKWKQNGSKLLRNPPLTSPLNTPSLFSHLTIKNRRAEDKKRAFISQINFEITSNYSNPDYTLNFLASKMALSTSQLYKKCSIFMGMNPKALLNEFRLNEAIQFLLNGESISGVAQMVGFSTHSSFGRAFKKRYGCSPSIFIAVQTFDIGEIALMKNG